MKVVSAQTLSHLEKQAYQLGYLDEDFMEKAGQGISQAVQDFINKNSLAPPIYLLCGKGNNGGDAFVAGCDLIEKKYQVTAIQLEDFTQCSPLCKKNAERFLAKEGKIVRQFESFEEGCIIVDGLFGTGFKGRIEEPYASLIEAANQSKAPILSIDIPSGLNGTTGEIEGSVIYANETLSLGLPKTGFFLGEGWNVVGQLKHIDFGLPHQLIASANADFYLNTLDEVSKLIPSIKRNRYKYQAGHVIGLAGSAMMPGAGLLSSLAAFRGGCGMVRLLYPKEMAAELAAGFYELIKIPYAEKKPQEVLNWMLKGKATFIGPGLGQSKAIEKLLKLVIPALKAPCVLDADALNLYAKGKFKLPAQAILTPHHGEMQTLLNSSSRLNLSADLLKTCQAYAEQHQCTLILKGSPTFIFQFDKPIRVNPTGDPGMATAGSGDVLTGLLAALLSQELNCHQAAILGVYLHGLAGEQAAKAHHTSRGLIATDLINNFGCVYQILESFNKPLVKL